MCWNWKGLSDRCTVSHEDKGVSCEGEAFVRKQILEENGRRSRGPVLGAASENMVGGATEHTTAKTQRVAALKVGEWVSIGKLTGPGEEGGW